MTVATLREAGDELVRESLQRALAETAALAPIAELRRTRFAYETSAAIDRLDVWLEDGERLALVVKDVGPGGLTDVAADAKPAFTLNPAREIEVYRSLLSPAGLSAPHYYGAAVDPRIGRAWLFLELVEGEVLTDVGDLSIWQAAVTWAARLDGAVDGAPAGLAHLLLGRDERWHAHWIDAAAAATESTDEQELATRLRQARATLLARIAALPRGFLHGELYPSNVLVGGGSEDGPRIAPVDWELAGMGPFALDLAALVSGWSRDDREAMCETFHQSLPRGRRETLSLTELSQAVDLCELSLALQWIGWSPDWVPPADHRRDWPREAGRLLGELGL